MTRVLLVEDHPADRRLVAEYLSELPETRLDETDRLESALDLVASHDYDCVVLDLSLPDADGLEGVEQLRVAAPTLPLVVLTGNRDERLALRAVRVGAQDFLAKHEIDARTLARALRYAIERQRSESRLARMALHDSLTGLPNRRLFTDRLEQALARRRRAGGEVAVLFADLDDFKAVNDAFGHAAGDELLRQLARRLQLAVRTSDTVARLGGDEFTICCEQVGSGDRALAVARRVLGTVDAPFILSTGTTSIGMSVGIACAGLDASDPSELVQRADAAMYRAKAEHAGLALASRA